MSRCAGDGGRVVPRFAGTVAAVGGEFGSEVGREIEPNPPPWTRQLPTGPSTWRLEHPDDVRVALDRTAVAG